MSLLILQFHLDAKNMASPRVKGRRWRPGKAIVPNDLRSGGLSQDPQFGLREICQELDVG